MANYWSVLAKFALTNATTKQQKSVLLIALLLPGLYGEMPSQRTRTRTCEIDLITFLGGGGGVTRYVVGIHITIRPP